MALIGCIVRRTNARHNILWKRFSRSQPTWIQIFLMDSIKRTISFIRAAFGSGEKKRRCPAWFILVFRKGGSSAGKPFSTIDSPSYEGVVPKNLFISYVAFFWYSEEGPKCTCSVRIRGTYVCVAAGILEENRLFYVFIRCKEIQLCQVWMVEKKTYCLPAPARKVALRLV